MKVGSLVERIEIANAAGNWIVANRRRLAPTFWVIAVMMPLAVFWIGPLLLQDGWVRDAKSAHASWIETDGVPGARVMKPAEFLTGLRQLGPSPHLPDLSANGLEIRRVSFLPPKGGRSGAIHVGYGNADGCRITLWITPSRRSGDGALVEQHRGMAFSWYTGDLQYVVVRSGMHHERFHVLAKSARVTTLAREGLGGPWAFALGASVMFGRPCTS